jgi:hypothetical protein
MKHEHSPIQYPNAESELSQPRTPQTKRPSIEVSDPFPLLDPGEYVARCSEATYAWARQWKKWIARLVLEPQNYTGRPYTGRLCCFLGLGKNAKAPYAGQQSRFRRLLVEVNGDQPAGKTVEMEVFVGVIYDVQVGTVKTKSNGEPLSPEHWYSIVRDIHPQRTVSPHMRTVQPSNLVPFNPSTSQTLRTPVTDQHSNTVNTPLAKGEKKRGNGDDKFG